MGEKGLLSRVLAGKCGAFGTYCSPSASTATAPGQPMLRHMTDLYRFSEQTGRTQLFGVLGSPVAHSMGPAMFNTLFAADDVDAVYLPFHIESADELDRFLFGLCDRPWLHPRGFSVTVPHKSAALRWAGDGADSLSRRIGAANTLLFDSGSAAAFNTDYAGALAAILRALQATHANPKETNAAVLGAGGAARAVVAVLSDLGFRVIIYARSPGKAAALAHRFGAEVRPWEARTASKPALVVNCTPVGMLPDVDATPLPADALQPAAAVFDTVYNPQETRLLREARAAGCTTVDGVLMFVHQAAAQYELWTGRRPDMEVMTRFVTDRLNAVRPSPQEMDRQ